MAQYNLNVEHGVPGFYGRWNTAVVDLAEATQWAYDLSRNMQAAGTDYQMDGMGVAGVHRCLRDGDTSLVAASEKFMDAFRDLTFNGRAMRTIADVAGGAVNVAAHLAGTPLAMRRRQREISPMGPLTIFVDGSGSAMNSTQDLTKRGVALLGMIRMLAAVRPVHLYMACGGSFSDPERGGSVYSSHNLCASVFVRLDTATMDLSRDGFALAHPAFCRAFMFKACKDIPYRKRGQTVARDNGALGWELGGIESYRRHGLSAFCKALGCDQSQSVFFTPMYGDEVIGDPVKWIKEMMVRYGGQSAFDMEND